MAKRKRDWTRGERAKVRGLLEEAQRDIRKPIAFLQSKLEPKSA